MARRLNLVQEHLNKVVWFGGFPMRRGDVMTYLDEVAKEQDPKNWLPIREAGMLGNYQFNERHGYPPEGTEPITLAEFKAIADREERESGGTPSEERIEHKHRRLSRRATERSRRSSSTVIGLMR